MQNCINFLPEVMVTEKFLTVADGHYVVHSSRVWSELNVLGQKAPNLYHSYSLCHFPPPYCFAFAVSCRTIEIMLHDMFAISVKISSYSLDGNRKIINFAQIFE
jgi:hypothetical protein